MTRRFGRILAWGAAILVVVLLDRHYRRAPRHEAEWLAAGDVQVRALRTGQGDTTLVFLHGYSESLLSWRALIDGLSDRYRVAAFDLPGFGLSEKPAGPYDLPATLRRVEDFLDRWTTGPVVVVGHSMGGEVAAALALARPDRVVAVVLIAPAGYGLGLGLTDDVLDSADERVARWTLELKYLLVPDDDPRWIARPPGAVVDRSDSARDRAAAAVFREFDFTALRERYRELDQPVLLIWGGLDPLIPISIGRRIAAELPNGRMVELPNAWHRPMVEQPERVIREIVQFLESRAP